MGDRVGQQFGSYRLVRLLGEGAFAEVYLGEHIHLGSKAAIKVLHAHLASADERQQFSAEARTIVDLVHPHIVRLLDFGVEGGTPFFVMDYAPGGTLRQRHPRGAVLPPATVVSYVRQVADALSYAHEKRLVHRDIKPENLLLGRSDEVLVSDFGIAIIASTHYGSPQNVAGTVSYMAPEQLQGRPQRASDQYALGIVSYEWLTGTVPFHGTWLEVASQHALTPPQPLREKAPGLSPAIEAVVLTALAKERQQRFASARAFANALEQASSEQSSGFAVFAPPTISSPTLPTQAPPVPGVSWMAGSGPLAADLLAAPTRVLPSSSQDAPEAERYTSATASPLSPAGDESGHTLPTVAPGAPSPAIPRQRSRWALKTLLTFLVILLLGSGALGGLGLVNKGPLSFLSKVALPRATTTTQPRQRTGMITEFSLTTRAGPGGIAVGPDANLWFTELDGKGIGRITPQGRISEYLIPTPNSQPGLIITGPDGNLWFAEDQGNKIGRITPTGTITEYPIPTPKSIPDDMIVGPDGNLWFTEGLGNKIGRITPQGRITEYTPSTASSSLTSITVGPDRNLWFTEQGSAQIGRITPQGAITEYPIPTRNSSPFDIVVGPDGNLWFTEFSGGQVGRITPNGTITEYPIQPNSESADMVVGLDGTLWFDEPGVNDIGRITLLGIFVQYPIPTPASETFGLITGPDGNLWFVERSGNKIGRITPQGTITEYPVPTPNSLPVFIVVGPDKNLWFTEIDGNKIGRITSGV